MEVFFFRCTNNFSDWLKNVRKNIGKITWGSNKDCFMIYMLGLV